MPICFDLDGTLGHFSSGFVLLREALGELWGKAPTPEELSRCAGSTDWEIVAELHQERFGQALDEAGYEAYEAACVTRFRATFRPGGRAPELFQGIRDGMHQLAASHSVWLVSGNAPALLAFKAEALGISPDIPRLGSLPRHGRTDLLRRAQREGPGPHLYVGDRPHDLAAAQAAGLPFLAVGTAVPGHLAILDATAEARCVVAAALAALAAPGDPTSGLQA